MPQNVPLHTYNSFLIFLLKFSTENPRKLNVFPLKIIFWQNVSVTNRIHFWQSGQKKCLPSGPRSFAQWPKKIKVIFFRTDFLKKFLWTQRTVSTTTQKNFRQISEKLSPKIQEKTFELFEKTSSTYSCGHKKVRFDNPVDCLIPNFGRFFSQRPRTFQNLCFFDKSFPHTVLLDTRMQFWQPCRSFSRNAKLFCWKFKKIEINELFRTTFFNWRFPGLLEYRFDNHVCRFDNRAKSLWCQVRRKF